MMTRASTETFAKRASAATVWCVRGHEYQGTINPSDDAEALDS
jgi:hypothetical protein